MLVLHRLVPPRAVARRRPARRRARARAARARAARADARRAAGHLRPLPLAAARARLPALGRVGGAGARAGAAHGCAARSPSSSSTRTTPFRQATRSARVRAHAARAPLVVSVHGGDVLYTAAARARRRAGGRTRRSGRRGWCSPTARASPSSPRARRARDPRRAPRHRPARAAGRAPRRGQPAVARDRRAPGRPQAPRRRAARAGRARRRAIRRCATRSSATAPSGSRSKELASRLGVARRVDFHGQLAPERGGRAGAPVHAVRDALDRGGLRRRLRRGDGRRACPRSAAAASRGRRRSPRPATASCSSRPGDIERLSQRIDELLSDPHRLREAGQRARATVAANFTWERCGEQTLAAYRDARCAMKPLLFVTGHVARLPGRALARLHEREQIELALFGGRSKHGGPARAARCPSPPPGAPARARAARRKRATTAPSSARPAGALAPLATLGGRPPRARVPLILWASLWAHPRSPAHALSYLPLRRLYRSADAVVTYGPHVSAYVRARGARNVYVAPQSVDNDFWRAAGLAPPAPRLAAASCDEVPVRRPAAPEKGLRRAARGLARSGLRAPRRRSCSSASTRRRCRAGGARGSGGSIVRLGRLAPESCATCTPPAACSWCPRSRPAPFASPGGWWSTRP